MLNYIAAIMLFLILANAYGRYLDIQQVGPRYDLLDFAFSEWGMTTLAALVILVAVYFG